MPTEPTAPTSTSPLVQIASAFGLTIEQFHAARESSLLIYVIEEGKAQAAAMLLMASRHKLGIIRTWHAEEDDAPYAARLARRLAEPAVAQGVTVCIHGVTLDRETTTIGKLPKALRARVANGLGLKLEAPEDHRLASQTPVTLLQTPSPASALAARGVPAMCTAFPEDPRFLGFC